MIPITLNSRQTLGDPLIYEDRTYEGYTDVLFKTSKEIGEFVTKVIEYEKGQNHLIRDIILCSEQVPMVSIVYEYRKKDWRKILGGNTGQRGRKNFTSGKGRSN